MTQPPFMLLPETNAFCDILLSISCCCDGNNADVNLLFNGAVVFVAAAAMSATCTVDSVAADSSDNRIFGGIEV